MDQQGSTAAHQHESSTSIPRSYSCLLLDFLGVLTDEKMRGELARLAESYRLFVFSNSSRAAIERNLGEEIKYFEKVFCYDNLPQPKPYPQSYTFVLEELEPLGIEKDSCLFIDDNEQNTEAARQVGIQSLLFTSAEQLAKLS